MAQPLDGEWKDIPADQVFEVADPTAEAQPNVAVSVEVHSVTSVPAELAAPEPGQSRPGTHFLAELQLGANVNGDFGFAGALLTGVGGRLPGTPLRFYLTAELGHSAMQSRGQIDTRDFQEERYYTDLLLGVRSYIPIFGPLRFFLELGAGATLSSARLEQDGEQLLFGEGWYGTLAFGGGLQARILHSASVGLRVRSLLRSDPLDDLRVRLGIDGHAPIHVTGSFTWHF